MTDGKLYTVTLDDDPSVAKMIERAMEMTSLAFLKAKELVPKLPELDPVTVFVDMHLGPSESGLDVLPALRERWSFVPIIVVTSDTADDAIAQALSSGANDFIRKPINKSEIVARVKARLGEMQRYRGEEQLHVGGLTFNRRLRTLAQGKLVRHLSPKEALLFESLAQARGMLMQRAELKRKVWGDTKVTDNAFDKLLHKVRSIVKDLTLAVTINSIYGGGIQLEVGEAAQKLR